MFDPTNPDIDTDRLTRRARLERERPAWRTANAVDDAPPAGGVHADRGGRARDRLAGVKRRLRAIPVLGHVLVRLNAWRRSVGLAPRLGRARWLLGGARWVKSLIRLNRTREDVHATARRLDELHDLMMAMKDTTAARVEAVADRADRLHGDVLYQQQRLDQLVEQGVRAAVAGGGEGGEPSGGRNASEAHVSARLANVYEAFEDRFRGDRGDIKARQAVYLDPIRAAGAGSPGRPILDIGCGRGEWLELLGEHGLTAYGVDVNGRAVAIAQDHGADARAQDLFAALGEAGEGTLGAVTAFHVVEHLEMETLVDVLDAARTALAPNGMLILETPNPENLIVGAHTFHTDPTHKAPIPPAVGQFLVTQRGFADATIWRLHPMSDTDPLPGDDPGTQEANRLLYGPQDYAVLARRP